MGRIFHNNEVMGTKLSKSLGTKMSGLRFQTILIPTVQPFNRKYMNGLNDN